MIQANVAEVKARLSHYLKLARGGERVIICDRNRPIAELVGLVAPIDKALRESAFGLFAGQINGNEIDEALRPMTDAEADAFIEGMS